MSWRQVKFIVKFLKYLILIVKMLLKEESMIFLMENLRYYLEERLKISNQYFEYNFCQLYGQVS